MKPKALFWGALLILAGSGCDGPKTDKTATAGASASAASRPSSPWTVGDQPVKHVAALVTGTQGETALRLTLSTAPLSCDSLAASFPGGAVVTNATLLDIWLTQPLEKSGQPGPWSLAGALLTDGKGRRGLTTQGAQVAELSITGQDVHIRGLDLAALDGATGRTVMWSGDLAASLCPKIARQEADRPQDKLELSVAGTKLPIHGATVIKTSAGVVLRLSTEPHTCSAGPVGTDLAIALTLNEAREAVTAVELSGYVLPGVRRAAAEDLGIAARSTTDPEGKPEVQLSGKAAVRGYDLELNGTARPRACPPPGD